MTQVAGWNIYTFLLWTLKSAMCTYYILLSVSHNSPGHFDADHCKRQLRLKEKNDRRLRTYCDDMRRRPPVHCFGLPSPEKKLADLIVCLDAQCLNLTPEVPCQPAISRINVFVVFVFKVKAGLMVMFSDGIFVTIAGTLRTVLIITVSFPALFPTVTAAAVPLADFSHQNNSLLTILSLRTPAPVPNRRSPGPSARPSLPL
ncbi:hypothetical protein PG993_012515 [Apiospora rasikravindrae]|uniref:Uncharacterized protein n=1 Tax=Apiospora rasikravindrae TaxID=990691 RepID=A0ABR1S2Q0_9PEZI